VLGRLRRPAGRPRPPGPGGAAARPPGRDDRRSWPPGPGRLRRHGQQPPPRRPQAGGHGHRARASPIRSASSWCPAPLGCSPSCSRAAGTPPSAATRRTAVLNTAGQQPPGRCGGGRWPPARPGCREPFDLVGGPAGAQLVGGLVGPDGDDHDGLVAEPGRLQLPFQPGQQPLGGVVGDAQVEHGMGREADLRLLPGRGRRARPGPGGREPGRHPGRPGRSERRLRRAGWLRGAGRVPGGSSCSGGRRGRGRARSRGW
jgi:hypothetical protein